MSGNRPIRPKKSFQPPRPDRDDDPFCLAKVQDKSRRERIMLELARQGSNSMKPGALFMDQHGERYRAQYTEDTLPFWSVQAWRHTDSECILILQEFYEEKDLALDRARAIRERTQPDEYDQWASDDPVDWKGKDYIVEIRKEVVRRETLWSQGKRAYENQNRPGGRVDTGRGVSQGMSMTGTGPLIGD